MIEWETEIARYELQSGKAFADDYKIATLMVHSPEPFRSVLRNAPAAARASYQLLVAHLREYRASGMAFAPTGVPFDDPMQVDQVGAIQGAGKAPKGGKNATEKRPRATGRGSTPRREARRRTARRTKES